MGFFDRLKQLGGYIPTQTIIIGQFAFEEERKITQNADEDGIIKRENITIVCEFFETNSANIVIKKIDKEERFSLMRLPYNFENFAVPLQILKTEELFEFQKNEMLCSLIDRNSNSIRLFY